MSLICIPVRAHSLTELRTKIIAAEKDADVIEIWIDHFDKQPNPKAIMGFTSKPLLIVNKSREEGGCWRGTEQEKIALLEKYLKAGVRFIDISLETNSRLLKDYVRVKKNHTTLILSYHDFRKTPSSKILWSQAKKGFELGANIVKIVTTAQKTEDNFTILQLLEKSQKEKKKLIAFCMGEKAKISRLLAPYFHSSIIYLAQNEKSRTAPGQLTIQEFKKYKLHTL